MRIATGCAKAWIGVLAVLPPLTHASPAGDGEDVFSSLTHEFAHKLEQVVKQRQVAGLSVALVDGKRIVWSQGFGTGETESDRPITQHTPFRVGSISKVFTALRVLQLEQQGLIDIDQPLYLYLPRFHMQSRFSDNTPVTVRQVLTHHGGLPTDLYKGQWTTDRFSTLTEQLRSEYVAYPPGFIHSYSNVGYSLLGSMIEATTGMPLEQAMQEAILKPLGLSNTGFHAANLAQPVSAAFDRQLEHGRILPLRVLPALGLYSSAHDLARFLTMLLDRNQSAPQKILADSFIEDMFEHQNADVALDFDDKIGIPWKLDQCGITDAGKIAEHGGTTMYYSSQIMLSMEYGLGVVVLSNTAGSRGLVETLAEELLAQAIDLNRQHVPMTVVSSSHQPPPIGDYSKPVEVGEYLTEAGLIEIDQAQNKLCQCDNRRVLDLAPLPNGWFQLKTQNKNKTSSANGFSMAEVKVNQNAVVLFRDQAGRTHRVGSLLQTKPIPPAWLQRLGKYEVINPDDGFRLHKLALFERDSRLYLQYQMPDLAATVIELPITPISDYEAVTSGLGRNRGETIRIQRFAADNSEYLLFSGYVAQATLMPSQ